MKNFFISLLSFSMLLTLCGCGALKKETYTIREFESLLKQMPVYIKYTNYIEQDEDYKSLYPDMLGFSIQNMTNDDIKNAVVSLVAWDSNNLPVKIKKAVDFTDGTYILDTKCEDINLAPGQYSSGNYGTRIDYTCGINSFKAIVKSYETFDGTTWENPYYDEWAKLYKNVKYDSTMTVNVKVEEVEFDKYEKAVVNKEKEENKSSKEKDKTSKEEVKPAVKPSTQLSEEQLLNIINTQEVKVIDSKYVVNSTDYKTLYPDMIKAVFINNTNQDIKNCEIGYLAWDKNNLPVKIKSKRGFDDGAYYIVVTYDDVNMIPGATHGENSGIQVDENCGIATVKAIVVSYTTFEGKTWNNPYIKDWRNLYENKKLK